MFTKNKFVSIILSFILAVSSPGMIAADSFSEPDTESITAEYSEEEIQEELPAAADDEEPVEVAEEETETEEIAQQEDDHTEIAEEIAAETEDDIEYTELAAKKLEADIHYVPLYENNKPSAWLKELRELWSNMYGRDILMSQDENGNAANGQNGVFEYSYSEEYDNEYIKEYKNKPVIIAAEGPFGEGAYAKADVMRLQGNPAQTVAPIFAASLNIDSEATSSNVSVSFSGNDINDAIANGGHLIIYAYERNDNGGCDITVYRNMSVISDQMYNAAGASDSSVLFEEDGLIETNPGEFTIETEKKHFIVAAIYNNETEEPEELVSHIDLTPEPVVVNGMTEINMAEDAEPEKTERDEEAIILTPEKVAEPKIEVRHSRIKGKKSGAGEKPVLTITAGSIGKDYDGTPLTYNVYSADGLLDNDYVDSVEISGTQTDAGESENTPENAVILNENNEDVTDTYDIQYVPGTLTVNKLDVTVSGILAEDKEYDGTNSAVLNCEHTEINGTLFGEELTTEAEGTFAEITPGENIAVTITGIELSGEGAGNYNPVWDGTQLSANISRKAVSVTAEDKEKYFHDDDPEFTVIIDGAIEGEPVEYSTERIQGENIGTYTITPVGDDVQGNYVVSYYPGTLTIDPRPIRVVPNNASKTYDETDPELSYELFQFDHDEWIPWEEGVDVLDISIFRQEGEDVGTYAIYVEGETAQGNYEVEYTEGTFTVEPKDVFVYPDPQTKIYGEEDPLELTYQAEGLVNDDEILFDVSISRDPGEDVGEYPILPTISDADRSSYVVLPDGSVLMTNYRVRFTPGTLTIEPKEITVRALDLEKDYSSEDGILTSVIEGDLTQEDVEYTHVPRQAGGFDVTAHIKISGNYGEITDDVHYVISRAVGENSGTYIITPSGARLQQNYIVSYESGTMTILPRYLTVSAVSASKKYGDPDPELITEITGLSNDDELTLTDEVTAAGVHEIEATITHANGAVDIVTYSVEREHGADVGEAYEITVYGEERQCNGNYAISFVNGTFTIYPKIIIRKTLVNEAIPESTTFHFLASLETDSQVISDLFDENKEYAFTLTVSKNNPDSETSFAVPLNTVFTISETDESTFYTPEISVEGHEEITGTDTATFTVTENEYTVICTNTRVPVCQIGDRTFTTISAAISYAGANLKRTATIELLSDYSLLDIDKIIIPAGYNITLKSQGTEAHTITRTDASAAVLTNNGAIKLENIIIDGNNAVSTAPMIQSAGTVTISNGAELINAKRPSGNGAAIYASSGTVNIEGGEISGNSAANGSAVYIYAGTLNISGGEIRNNEATSGGAVGVENASTRINLKQNAYIYNNEMVTEVEGEEVRVNCNIYLDADSDVIINSSALSANAQIGVYATTESTRGTICAQFGSCSDAANLTAFVNDRDGGLDTWSDNNKLIWGKQMSYEVRVLNEFDTDSFPPQTAGSTVSQGVFYPHKSAYTNIYDFITEELYAQYAESLADDNVFAYAYAETQATSFEDYVTTMRWDGESSKWKYGRGNTNAPEDGNGETPKLIIYYSKATFITIANNTKDPSLNLKIDVMDVLGKDEGDGAVPYGYYGYVTAKNGKTQTTLIPVTESTYNPDGTYKRRGDLVLYPGESIKLMFPGACSESYVLHGIFSGDDDLTADVVVKYSVDGGAKQNLPTTLVDGKLLFELSDYSLPGSGRTTELVFGESTAIFQVVSGTAAPVPFATLNAALDYIRTNQLQTSSIEMLTDYLIPSGDVITSLPLGYNITLTSAGFDPEDEEPVIYTISRDIDNKKSFIAAEFNDSTNSTTLNIVGINMDGRALIGTGDGGAVNTKNCNVYISHVDLSGFVAKNGGAVYINFTNGTGILEVRHAVFDKDVSNSSTNRQGGGAIWTAANQFTLEDASFTNCSADDQGGAVFHCIENTSTRNNVANSMADISGCSFSNCTARAAGAIESDALEISIKNSSYDTCYAGATKTAGARNAGAVNCYIANSAIPTFDCHTYIEGCTFNNCWTEELTIDGKPTDPTRFPCYGGGFRSNALRVEVINCSFTNTRSRQGGAIAITNNSAAGTQLSTAHITGCQIDGCEASINGGAILCSSKVVYIDDNYTNEEGETFERETKIENCTTTGNGGAIYLDTASCEANLNGDFLISNNAAIGSTSRGGGIYMNSGTLTIDGNEAVSTGITDSNTHDSAIVNCSATYGGGICINTATLNVGNTLVDGQATNGGGVYHQNKSAVTHIKSGGTVGGTVRGNGGGIYMEFGTADMEDGGRLYGFADKGGGLFIYGGTFTMSGGIIGGLNTNAANASATNGGGVYTGGAGAFLMNDGTIAGSIATYGGGIYTAGGTTTVNGGSVKGNSATTYGGGVCAGGGTVTVGGIIGGQTATDANDAPLGAGVFVESNKTATVSAQVIGNKNGAGAAVGGADAKIVFAGSAQVKNNTLRSGRDLIDCNVYLNYPVNTIIRTGGLSETADIGVYVPDGATLYDEHGDFGMPFGTDTTSGGTAANINRFFSDRNGVACYGIKKGAVKSLIYWMEYACKLTDASGQLLYREKDGEKVPAVYSDFDFSRGTSYNQADPNYAFSMLRYENPELFLRTGAGTYTDYTGKTIRVEMLETGYVSDIAINTYNSSKDIILTTASSTPYTTEDENEKIFVYKDSAKSERAVIYRGGTFINPWFTIRSNMSVYNVILDGSLALGKENGGAFNIKANYNLVIGTNATVRGSKTTASGGAVYYEQGAFKLDGGSIENCQSGLDGGAIYNKSGINGGSETGRNALVINPGSVISGCVSGRNGGGIYHSKGGFYFLGGTIKNCSATNGGGIYATGGQVVNMSGTDVDTTPATAITGNTATTSGGGITIENTSNRINFKGKVLVKNNKVNNQKNNMALTQTSDRIINSTNLAASSEIGVYVPDNLENAYGKAGCPFGARITTDTQNLNAFINDRNSLRGGVREGSEYQTKTCWVAQFALKITNSVVSDLAADKNGSYQYRVHLEKNGVPTSGEFIVEYINSAGGITSDTVIFDRDGNKVFDLTKDQSVVIDDIKENTDYTVTELFENEDAQHFTVAAALENPEQTYDPATLTAAGVMGENLEYAEAEDPYTSSVSFTNTRKSGKLIIKNIVSEEYAKEVFLFTVRLDDRTISRSYDGSYDGIGANGESMTFIFRNGVSVNTIALKHNQQVEINGLPSGLGYTVEENMNRETHQHINYRCEEVANTRGVIPVDSDITAIFRNRRLDYVCKVMSSDGILLYYRDDTNDNQLTPAYYPMLEDAFAAVNKGAFRTSSGASYSNTNGYRVEMIKSEYELEAPISINSNRTTVLTTASTETATQGDIFPGPYEGPGDECVITRGHNAGSLFTTKAALTLTNITIDGNGDEYTYDGNGGLVYISTSGSLTMQSGSVLQNSKTTMNGSAVFVSNSRRFTMTAGTVMNNEVTDEEGGAVGIGGTSARLAFSGASVIQQNGYNIDGTRVESNVYIDKNSGSVISSNGLDTGAHIGIFVSGASEGMETNPYKSRGDIFDDFGTYTNEAGAYHFTNDRNGMSGATRTGNKLVWMTLVPLTVTKELIETNSDEFVFDVSFKGTGNGHTYHIQTENGLATLTEGENGKRSISISQDGDTGEPDEDGFISVGTANIQVPTDTEITLEESLRSGSISAYITQAKENGYTNTTQPTVTGHAVQFKITRRAENASVTVRNTKTVCKITDSAGNILYQDEEHKVPAVYSTLDNEHVIAALGGTLYTSRGRTYSGSYCIKMLAEEYEIKSGLTIEMPENISVTLTTAGANDRDFPYAGEAPAIICRAFNTGDEEKDILSVAQDSRLILKDIVLDGQKETYNGRAAYIDGGILEMQDNTVIRNFRQTAEGTEDVSGGGILVGAGGLLEISGNARMENNHAGFGGAIYNNGVIRLAGTPVISGNTADEKGAGIFLTYSGEDAGVLSLAGLPDFGGTDTEESGAIKGESGNFLTTTLPNAKNGGKRYEKARQDIFAAGTTGEDEAFAAIVIAENLDENMPAGSIWVWMDGDEEHNHYYMMKQFAVMSDTFEGEISEPTYNAFRNARPDRDTGCGSVFLTGQEGEDIAGKKCVYWTGGFSVSFMKVDGYGTALPGAEFTLYTDIACTTEYIQGEIPATAVSADGTDSYTDENGETLEAGTVLFKNVAGGVYYMKETNDEWPETGEEGSKLSWKNENTYIVLVGTSALEIPEEREGLWTGVLSNITETDISGQTADGEKNYAIFLVEGTDPKATAMPDIAAYGVMNTCEKEAAVILSKISHSLQPLSGAEFKVLRYDLTPVMQENEDGIMSDTFTSDESGVYFIGRLPLGTYYAKEEKAPVGYKKAEHYYIFKITENGIEDWEETTTNIFTEPESEEYLINNGE